MAKERQPSRAVKQVLQRALNKLRVCGWIQGRSGSQWSGYCLLGAIHASVFSDSNQSKLAQTHTYHQVMRVLGFSTDVDCVRYNDAPERKRGEVFKLLRDAIKRGKKRKA